VIVKRGGVYNMAMNSRLLRMAAMALGALGWSACNSTQAPNPPFALVIAGGDAQTWYFNNPLPTPLSVAALDVDGVPVSGVVVTWTVASGAGAVSPAQSTTDANGIASAIDSIGASTLQTVSATFAGLPGPTVFTETATTPPTSAAVAVRDNAFDPQRGVVQSGGTVTWTWTGTNTHNLTFTGGPTPLPANQGDQTNGATAQRTLTTVGTYSYHCTHHTGMTGSVTVVH
jgi:plastocyanin